MRAFIVTICLMSLLLPILCVAQDSSQSGPGQPPADPQFAQRRNQQDPDDAKIERQMARERNKQRQQDLKEDTDKLLKLATELKQYVDKTNENILSIDVLKKTDEIEKLAKSVREKMKAGGYEGVAQ